MHPKTKPGQFAKALALAVTLASVTILNAAPADAVLVVVPGVAGAGADVEFDANEWTVEPAMGTMKCDGAFVFVAACTASVTGKMQACVPVEGDVFGVGFSAEACAGIGAAGCASGTAALGIAQRQCFAIAHKEQIDYVTHHRCKPAGYVHDYVVWECHTEFERVTTRETNTDSCSQSENYALEDIQETLQHPTNPSVPAWHGRACKGFTSVQTPWTCIDLDATSYAKADVWDVADEAHTPGCRNMKDASKPPSGFQLPSAGVTGAPTDDPAAFICSTADALCVLLDVDPKEAACEAMFGLGFEECPPRSIAGFDPMQTFCEMRENMSKEEECLPDAQDVLVMVCAAVADPPQDPTADLDCEPDTAALLAMGKQAAKQACEGASERVSAMVTALRGEDEDGRTRGSIHINLDVELPEKVSVNCDGEAITTRAQGQSRLVPVSQLSASEQTALRTALYDGLKSAIDRHDPTLTFDPGLGDDRSLADQVWAMAYDGVLAGAAEALAQDFYVQVVPGDN